MTRVHAHIAQTASQLDYGETVELWERQTKNFIVSLMITRLPEGYEYDGDDMDGSIQEDLNDGTLIAFDSELLVNLLIDNSSDTMLLGHDSLGASVYRADDLSDFIDMRSYFGDMLSIACRAARETYRALDEPNVRKLS